MSLQRRGLLLVISSPSGAGKTSITRALLETDDRLHLSISATTRPPRPGEREGKDYYFLTPEIFEKRANNGDMLEHATVFGHSYGTPRAPIEKTLTQGRDVLLDIDWQGADQLREKIPDDVVSVFLLPPSVAELHRRLRDRKQDDAHTISERMRRAGGEISHWHKYDYVLINEIFDKTLKSVNDVLKAARYARPRQHNLFGFVQQLQQDIHDLPLADF
ncbi:MAG: guanylate kinase [Pseudomonadota bacterium]